MKKVAILLDGNWFRIRLDTALKGLLPNGVTADVMYRNALLTLNTKEEELFRLFYYDCPPYEGKETNPIDQTFVDFKGSKKFESRHRFLKELREKDFVAMRLGITKKRGWTLNESYIKRTIAGKSQPPQAADVFLSLEQKGVDMRIGIDVATLSLKRIVDRVILISGDIDMIPAMKLARREGVQVVLAELKTPVHKQMDEDADLVRCITPIA